MNLNQEQLIIFQTVIERGSFSAAARYLAKVPSAISMSIANLEIDLNLILFERKGREPTPTAAALRLYERTQYLLTEMNQWKQHAFALSQGLESTLNIVIVSELSHLDWPQYLSLIAEKFPALEINIFSAPQEDALNMLLNGTAQLAFMFEREILDHREQFVELKREILVPVASYQHPLAQRSHVYFEDVLISRQIVVASRDHHMTPELMFSQHHWRTDNHHSACAMILQNLGWGVLPQQMLMQNPQLQQQLQILNFVDFSPKFEYFVDLVWSRESNLGIAAHFLIDYIRNQRKN